MRLHEINSVIYKKQCLDVRKYCVIVQKKVFLDMINECLICKSNSSVQSDPFITNCGVLPVRTLSAHDDVGPVMPHYLSLWINILCGTFSNSCECEVQDDHVYCVLLIEAIWLYRGLFELEMFVFIFWHGWQVWFV